MTTQPPTESDDDLIWHYTSAEGLYGILTECVLHSGNILFMNDPKEFTFLFEVITNTVESDTKNIHSDAVRTCIVNRYKEIQNSFETLKNFFVYLTCFSKQPDLLSQWRGYCPNGGYSIGFSRKSLEKASAKQGYFTKDVIYMPDRVTKKVPRQLKRFFERHYNHPFLKEKNFSDQAFHKYHMDVVTKFNPLKLSPFVKHDSFSEEREVRLYRFGGEDSVFKISKDYLKPYGIIKFPKHCIKKIIIGPTLNENYCRSGLNSLLIKQNLNHILVEHSKIPYRTHH